MPLPASLAFAGVCAILNLWLAYRCVQIRLNGPGGVGDLGLPKLRARMRAHANFAEYTPFVLILFTLLEYTGESRLPLQVMGAVYVVGRILHAPGMERPRFAVQLIGALITWLVLLILAALAIWKSLHAF